jgi:hypothetical protein
MAIRAPHVAVAAFVGAGACLKLADSLGEGDGALAYIPATASGLLLGFLVNTGEEEASFVLGIIIGVALARKVDRLNLAAGLAATLATSILLGPSQPAPQLVLLASALAFLDELSHDLLSGRGRLGFLFRHRPALKLAAVAGAASSLISLSTALGLLGFDLGYEAVYWFLSRKGKTG